MNAFIDTSVLLRKLLGEPHPLREWKTIERAYASRVLPVEIGRVIDRYRLAGKLDDDDVARLHQEAKRVLRSIELFSVSESVLARAAGPMPTALDTLDAIHLATALEVAPTLDEPLVLTTHDQSLGRAARAFGFDVLGV